MNGMGAEHYDNERLWGDSYWSEEQVRRARETAEMVPGPASSILDVGCGAGVVTAELRALGKEAVGLDFAATPLQQMSAPRVQGDATRLPFAPRSFDAVVASEVIEHLPGRTRRAALDEAVRVADRWILLTVPYREVLEQSCSRCAECGCVFHMWRHTASFDEPSMRELLAPTFRVAQMRVLGPARRVPWTPLVRLGQLFGGYADPSSLATCPMCGNSESFVTRSRFVGRALMVGTWRLARSREGTWLAALYERE